MRVLCVKPAPGSIKTRGRRAKRPPRTWPATCKALTICPGRATVSIARRGVSGDIAWWQPGRDRYRLGLPSELSVTQCMCKIAAASWGYLLSSIAARRVAAMADALRGDARECKDMCSGLPRMRKNMLRETRAHKWLHTDASDNGARARPRSSRAAPSRRQ